MCLTRNYDVKPQECTYTIRGLEVGPKHMYCEFDDVLLTRIYNFLVTKGYFVTVISRDRDVNKETDVVGEVSHALRQMGASVKMGVELEPNTSPDGCG